MIHKVYKGVIETNESIEEETSLEVNLRIWKEDIEGERYSYRIGENWSIKVDSSEY